MRDLLTKQGFKVQSSIDQTPKDILTGLHGGAWRVMHLAGHGEHEAAEVPGGRPRSGMVIGPDRLLTPGDVAQMRHVPELVFINCCHLGKTTRDHRRGYNRLAANLGQQFIEMGVRAVVCAGWAVDDAAALTFARTFYDELFAGARFSEAVRRARTTVHDAHPAVNTWGAYQCYGDPAYRLQRGAGDTASSRSEPFVSPRELVVELGNLKEWSRVQLREADALTHANNLRQRVDALLQRVPRGLAGGAKDWLARADVAAEIGFAYGEGNLFADAVPWLERALAAHSGDCPVRAVEQCANFRVRLAAAEWQALQSRDLTDAERSQARNRLGRTIEDAVRELSRINDRAPTPERLSLLGGSCKRLAFVYSDRPRRAKALLDMAGFYRQALEMRGNDDHYALSNWGVACLLVQRLDPAAARGDWHAALAAMCVAQADRDAQRERGAERPDFWRASGLGDLELVQLLLTADDPAACSLRAARAGQFYAAAGGRGASPRERASLREHLDFLIEQAGIWPPHVAAALGELRAGL